MAGSYTGRQIIRELPLSRETLDYIRAGGAPMPPVTVSGRPLTELTEETFNSLMGKDVPLDSEPSPFHHYEEQAEELCALHALNQAEIRNLAYHRRQHVRKGSPKAHGEKKPMYKTHPFSVVCAIGIEAQRIRIPGEPTHDLGVKIVSLGKD